MTEQRKRGRPKKDPNAPKSNYYYSFAVKARKQSQKRLRDARKTSKEKATKQAEDKRHYAKKLKEKITRVDKALRDNPESTLIDKEDLQGLPNAVEQLVDGREIIFQPNEGPQEEFLSSSERDVLYGGSAGGGKVLPFLLTPLGIVIMAIIVGFFLGVLLMSLLN